MSNYTKLVMPSDLNPANRLFGNHDKNMYHDAVKPFFKSMGHYKEIYFENQMMVLSHYAFLEWNQMHRGAYMLHGHSHNTMNYPDQIKNCRILDIGVDVHGMRPISFTDIKAIMDKREIFKYPERKYEQ